MKKYIILIFCCLFEKNYAEQFIYPVADFNDGKQLMVLYQKSLYNVELWMWDTTNQYAIKGLSSFLTPANLRVMPSGKGFSFIDQGYIKVKEFAKRSPKTLPIYEPIGLFSSMNWIDDETFYFVAREGDFFQIFQGDLQANIMRLTSESADALYPQKINDKLFYMRRDMNGHIQIFEQPWDPMPIATSCESAEHRVSILKKSVQQLCFLHMISEEEGFYLQAPMKKSDNNIYKFSCFHLTKNDRKKWVTEKIFTFQIPSKYLTGPDQLYESLEPFLPNYNSLDWVYFVTWDEDSDQFQLKKFDIYSKDSENIEIRNLYKKQNQQIFAPYIHHNIMHCGFIISEEEQRNSNSMRSVFEMDDVYFQLPHIQVK